MVWGDHIRSVAAAALVTISLAGLTACGSTTTDDHHGLTLAQTKSPVQLLRNEAASRIDEFVVETVDETEDVSVACKTEDKDPLGRSRSWTSSVEVSLKAGSAWRAGIVAEDLIASFEKQGWVASRGLPSAVTYTGLKSETSAAQIGLTLSNEDVAAGLPAKLLITTKGPCVATDGAASDEVAKLETAK